MIWTRWLESSTAFRTRRARRFSGEPLARETSVDLVTFASVHFARDPDLAHSAAIARMRSATEARTSPWSGGHPLRPVP